jgi:hypothetical protein
LGFHPRAYNSDQGWALRRSNCCLSLPPGRSLKVAHSTPRMSKTASPRGCEQQVRRVPSGLHVQRTVNTLLRGGCPCASWSSARLGPADGRR